MASYKQQLKSLTSFIEYKGGNVERNIEFEQKGIEKLDNPSFVISTKQFVYIFKDGKGCKIKNKDRKATRTVITGRLHQGFARKMTFDKLKVFEMWLLRRIITANQMGEHEKRQTLINLHNFMKKNKLVHAK